MISVLTALEKEVTACINCGFCEAVCPTLPASDYRASMGARGRINLAKEFLEEVSRSGRSKLSVGDAFNSCLSCYACLQVCPAGVNAGRASDYMKQVIASGQLLEKRQEHPIARMIVELTLRYKDPLGLGDKCADWANGIEFDNDSTTILYTGHMYQLMAYNKKLRELLNGNMELMRIGSSLITRAPALAKIMRGLYDKEVKDKMEKYLRNVVTLLKAAGIKFRYLGVDEPYPGTLLLDMGYVNEFANYARQVADLFHEKGVKRIIVIDPHTYDILINEYPKYVPNFDFEVVHYLDLLGSLQFKSLGDSVTYHEPCHLKRRMNYDKPLELLSKVGQVKMPRHNGKNTMCCGGPDEAFYPRVSNNVAVLRFKELKETSASKIVTACPICFVNLDIDGSVVDISQVLVDSLMNQAPR
ncbi:MAG: (Fe-S)-binding protein [Thermocladium sp.]